MLAKASGEISTRYARQWYDERYVPIPGLPSVELPRGIKVAGPLNTAYGEIPDNSGGGDDLWVSQPGGRWRLDVDWNGDGVPEAVAGGNLRDEKALDLLAALAQIEEGDGTQPAEP